METRLVKWLCDRHIIHLFLEDLLQHLFNTADNITMTPAHSSKESWGDLSAMQSLFFCYNPADFCSRNQLNNSIVNQFK